eukprot:5704597-Prymnesium_polylepis.1
MSCVGEGSPGGPSRAGSARFGADPRLPAAAITYDEICTAREIAQGARTRVRAAALATRARAPSGARPPPLRDARAAAAHRARIRHGRVGRRRVAA